jgi:hypothetical protein
MKHPCTTAGLILDTAEQMKLDIGNVAAGVKT